MSLLLIALVAAEAASAVEPESEPKAPSETIIVTGTRLSGIRAKDSVEPVQVVSSDSLEDSGSPGLNNALASVVASFNTQAVGNDLANETLSARLRGLSPNHTLVLINGKRLHGSGNLSVLSSSFQGGAAPDLHFVPLQAVERVEVLLDGAAAQYGSDAIAGVINLILKSDRRGGTGEAYAGQYFKGDGETLGATGNLGIPLGKNGFLNLTAEHRFHDYSNAGGPDQRVVLAVESGEHPEWADLENYPYVNRVFGDAKYRLTIFSANAMVPLAETVELYSFGTLGRKKAGGWANFRLPTRLPQLYPDGFTPIDRLLSHDYSATSGVRGTLSGWGWDFSSTYGLNRNKVTVTNSANVDLFNDTGSTPTDFYNGGFRASQWTTNLDFNRRFEGRPRVPGGDRRGARISPRHL